jgi:flagellar biosynthesis protein FliQ
MGGLWKLIGLGAFSNYLMISATLAVIGLVFGIIVAVHYRYMPVGTLKENEAWK